MYQYGDIQNFMTKNVRKHLIEFEFDKETRKKFEIIAPQVLQAFRDLDGMHPCAYSPPEYWLPRYEFLAQFLKKMYD